LKWFTTGGRTSRASLTETAMAATVLYSSPFVPPEWIEAHGLHACRTSPGPTDNNLAPAPPAGVCAFAENYLGEALQWGGPVIFATLCDQMRRAADQLILNSAPDTMFVLNVPATWQSAAARQLYSCELERLGRFLVRHGGRTPEPVELSGIMGRFAADRERLLRACPMLPAREFAEAVAKFHRGGTLIEHNTCRKERGVRLGLIGAPMLQAHLQFLDCIESLGGEVVFNGTAGGEQGLLPADFPEGSDKSPFQALITAYFDSVPDVARRPNSPFYNWIEKRLRQTQAQGVIVWHYAWCDLWKAEATWLRDQFELPVLDLDAGDAREMTAQARTRVEAFLETLDPK
jgi:benzoyl-CoA reductase/2-hydroxyglutaryl-CoA dehydratase subunit BcrC/BadD/HgdB